MSDTALSKGLDESKIADALEGPALRVPSRKAAGYPGETRRRSSISALPASAGPRHSLETLSFYTTLCTYSPGTCPALPYLEHALGIPGAKKIRLIRQCRRSQGLRVHIATSTLEITLC